jgi:tetratricopeptide (TPR) repeat protein
MAKRVHKLNKDEAELLARLDVFVGSFSFQAALEICGCARLSSSRMKCLLDRLVERGVLQESPFNDHRYAVEEAYRAEFDDADRLHLRKRHFEWYVTWAEQRSEEMRWGDPVSAAHAFDDEYENVRAALTWGTKYQQEDLALRLVVACFRYWFSRGRIGEALTWFERVLEMGLFGPTYVRAKATNLCGVLMNQSNDPVRAKARFEQALGVGLMLDAPEVSAAVFGNLATLLDGQGDRDGAIAMQRQAVAMFRTIGDPDKLTTGLGNLTRLLLAHGSLYEAGEVLQEWKDLSPQARDPWNDAILALIEAKLLLEQGRYDLAEESLALAVTEFRRQGNNWYTVDCLTVYATIASHRGWHERVAILLGAVEAARSPMGAEMLPASIEPSMREVMLARDSMGDERFDELFEEGLLLTLEQASAYAMGKTI